jgi:hypothetical protein
VQTRRAELACCPRTRADRVLGLVLRDLLARASVVLLHHGERYGEPWYRVTATFLGGERRTAEGRTLLKALGGWYPGHELRQLPAADRAVLAAAVGDEGLSAEEG